MTGPPVDPQNPFAATPPSASKVEDKGDPQNPFAQGEEPSPALEFAKGAVPAATGLVRGMLELPADLVTKSIMGEVSVEEAQRQFHDAARWRPGLLPIFREQLDNALAKHQAALDFKNKADAHARFIAAREKAGLPPSAEEITTAAEMDPADALHSRYITAIKQVLGLQELPPTPDDVSRFESLVRTGVGVTSFPAHLYKAFDQATTNQQLGQAFYTALFTGATFAIPGKPGAKALVEDRVARSVPEEAPVAPIAQSRVLDQKAPSELSTPPAVIPMRDVPLPQEGELAGIKARLLAEEAGDVGKTIARAQSKLSPFGTTVVPELERVGNVLASYKRTNPEGRFAVFERPDGKYDLAVFGDQSPLTNDALRKQFQDEGFFEGQEVSYGGKNWVYRGLSKTGDVVTLGDAVDPKEVAYVPISEVRRPAYTDNVAPFSFELRKEPYTQGDVIRQLDLEQLMSPEQSEERRAFLSDQFNNYITTALGRDRDLTGGEAIPLTTFPSGMSDYLLYERARDISTKIDGAAPDTRVFVYSDPSGKPLGTMEVATLMNGGLPGTYKQILAGVEKPVPSAIARISTAITHFAIDPDVPRFTRARAAIELMKQAQNLGVDKILASVDEMGLRTAAHYINKYLGRRIERVAGAVAHVMTADLDAMYKDFSEYSNKALESPKFASRLSGHDLSKTVVKDERGEPLRVYHGTTQSFDQFDVEFQSPESLAGPGFYFTTDPRVATGYATSRSAPEGHEIAFESYAERDAWIRENPDQPYVIEQGPKPSSIPERAAKMPERNFIRVVYRDAGVIRPAYLDIRKPFDWDAPADPKFAQFAKQRLIENSVPPEVIKPLDDLMQQGATNEQLWALLQHIAAEGDMGGFFDTFGDHHPITELLKEYGFDGIKYKGGQRIPQMDEAGKPIAHDAYVAFDPKQVVSPWIGKDLGFDQITATFAKENGFLPEELPALRKHLEQRMGKEARETYLTPDELALYNKLEKEMKAANGAAPSPLAIVSKMEELGKLPMEYLASSNNMMAQWTPHGAIEIRARETGDLLGRFKSEESAREFLNRSGQADGQHLDGGGVSNDIPPGGIAGTVMPPSPPRPPTALAAPDELAVPWFKPGQRVGGIFDGLRSVMEYLAPMEGWISSIDNVFFKELDKGFGPGFRATQDAARKAANAMKPFFDRLGDIDKLVKDYTKDQRRLLFNGMETMTPSEIVSKGFFRPLNEREVNVAEWMAAKHIDMAKVNKYVRELTELEGTYDKGSTKLDERTADLTKSYQFDEDHMTAAGMFRQIRDMHVDDAFIGHITRLGDAIMSDAPSRAEFVKRHDLPGNALVVMSKLDQYLRDVGDYAGTPDARRIAGWIGHFKTQLDPKGNFGDAFLNQKGLVNLPEMKFINELGRTGELSYVETDPINSALRYTRGAINSVDMLPTWNQTLKDWKSELARLPTGAQQKVSRVTSSYLSELRGVPEASVKFTDSVVRSIFDGSGMELDPKLMRDITNTVIAASSAGPMAFRIAMGMRDLVSGWMWGTTWFGVRRFNRMMALGWDSEAVAALHAKGAIPPQMSPVEFSTPVDLQASAIQKVGGKIPGYINKIADVGLKASLQPMVYDRLNAGAYLESHELASKNLTDYAIGKIDKDKAYSNMELDKYDPSFVRQFDTLVNQKNFEQAAHLLGQQTQRMIVPTYGQANHPYKWGTNTGRLLGQYGTWPVWMVSNTLRMLGRGGALTRTGVISRFAMSQAVVYLAGKALGFDLYSWLLYPGMRWMGGPLVNTARSVMNLVSPSEMEQQDAKRELARLVPSVSDPRSLYIPGSYAIGDWMQAVGALGSPSRTPSNPVEALGRGLGIPVSKDPSWLDDFLGTR